MIPMLLALALSAAPYMVDGKDLSALTVQQLYALSDEYWHAGDYRHSVQVLERVIQLDPTDTEAPSICAWLVWSSREDPNDPNYMGTEADARRYVVECVRRNPGSADACFEVGMYLLERIGDGAAAIPWLERALTLPNPIPPASRSLAHALFFSERYSEAVVAWQRAGERWGVESTVVSLNANKALARAMQADSMARSGGVVVGDPNLGEAPVPWRDFRFDDDQDGITERRELLLEDPFDRDGEADYRIRYIGKRAIYRYYWLWNEMAVDRNDDGQFADDEITLVDSNEDGGPDGGLTLQQMKERRGRELSPIVRRFVAADLWRIGTDGDGQPAPLEVTTGATGLTARPVATLLTSEPCRVRLYLHAPTERDRRALSYVDLPSAAEGLVTNRADGPAVALTVKPGELPAGRYFVFVEVQVRGVKMAEEPLPGKIAVVTAEGITLDDATEADMHPVVPQAGGPEGMPQPPTSVVPGHEGHQHD